MKKFRFPLRSVVTLRKLREGEQRERFAAAVQVHAKAEEARRVISARIVELEERIASERVGRFRPADQISFLQALAVEQTRNAEAAAQVAQAQLAMEKQRQAWLDSRRDVRLVEVLETKARAVHRQDHEREEQALLDDRTNALFVRAR